MDDDNRVHYENFIPETGEVKCQPFKGIPATIENSQMIHSNKRPPRSVVCYKVLYKDDKGNYYYCGTETILGRLGDVIGKDQMRDGYVEFRGFKSKYHCIRQAPYEGPLNEELLTNIVLMKVRLFDIRSHGKYTPWEPHPHIYMANKIQILEEVEKPNDRWTLIRWPKGCNDGYGDVMRSLLNHHKGKDTHIDDMNKAGIIGAEAGKKIREALVNVTEGVKKLIEPTEKAAQSLKDLGVELNKNHLPHYPNGDA